MHWGVVGKFGRTNPLLFSLSDLRFDLRDRRIGGDLVWLFICVLAATRSTKSSGGALPSRRKWGYVFVKEPWSSSVIHSAILPGWRPLSLSMRFEPAGIFFSFDSTVQPVCLIRVGIRHALSFTRRFLLRPASTLHLYCFFVLLIRGKVEPRNSPNCWSPLMLLKQLRTC